MVCCDCTGLPASTTEVIRIKARDRNKTIGLELEALSNVGLVVLLSFQSIVITALVAEDNPILLRINSETVEL